MKTQFDAKEELRIEVSLRREWQARAEKAEVEVARLRQKLKGIEIALARDENVLD